VIVGNGAASGINDYGWVVGESFTSGGAMTRKLFGDSHPFIWSAATGIVALPTLNSATGITGKFISGAWETEAGEIHGILLEGQP
jgi:hypothetical protein